MRTFMPNPGGKWNDNEWESFKEFLKHTLKKQVCEVTFTKVNGDIRVMDCTLDPSVLPAPVVKESSDKPARKSPENSLAVFDTNANGWRSFIIKNVQAVKYN